MRRAGYVLAHNAAPAEIILDWLFATRHLKNPADGEAAKADWARVFAPTAEGRSELVHHSTYVAKETLRLARIRLDCVNNLLMRAMFAATCVDQLALFLFFAMGALSGEAMNYGLRHWTSCSLMATSRGCSCRWLVLQGSAWTSQVQIGRKPLTHNCSVCVSFFGGGVCGEGAWRGIFTPPQTQPATT